MGEKERERIFEVAGMAGDILLRSGAEISRVDETMRRIACAYELENVSTFVLSNGIFSPQRWLGAIIRCGCAIFRSPGPDWTGLMR